MIDRLIHHSEILSLKGDSYRLRGKDLDTRIGSQTRRNRITHPVLVALAEALRTAHNAPIHSQNPAPSTRLKRPIAAQPSPYGLGLRGVVALSSPAPQGGSILNRRYGVNSQPALTPRCRRGRSDQRSTGRGHRRSKPDSETGVRILSRQRGCTDARIDRRAPRQPGVSEWPRDPVGHAKAL